MSEACEQESIGSEGEWMGEGLVLVDNGSLMAAETAHLESVTPPLEAHFGSELACECDAGHDVCGCECCV